MTEKVNPLEMIMSVDDAAKMWDSTPGYIKNLCAANKIRCIKIGKTWVIDKTQPKPNIKADPTKRVPKYKEN